MPVVRSLVFTAFVLLAGCVRLAADHCANQDDPVAYCTTEHAMAFCSACRAETDGCRPDRPKTGCEVDSATNATPETSASGAETGTSSSASGESTLGETLGTSSSTATTMTATTDGDSSTGDPPPGCGNGIVEPTLEENCDGDNLPATTCEQVALTGGELGCYPPGTALECKYDLSMCTGAQQCGNDVIEGTEPCDGTDLAGQTCETLSEDYIGGTLGCRPQCDAFDTSLCELCRMQGDDCDGDHPCCAGLLCGVVTGMCGLL